MVSEPIKDQDYINTIYYVRKSKDRMKLLNIAQNCIQQIKHIAENYGENERDC